MGRNHVLAFFTLFGFFLFYLSGCELLGIDGIGSDSDDTPPGEVTEVTAVAEEDWVDLVWTNPEDEDFAGVIVVRRDDGYPANTSDGDTVFDGNTSTIRDENLTLGTTYYYTVFTYDSNDNYSAGEQVSARLAAHGEVLGSFPAPTGASFLAHDGTFLWCTTSDTLYKLDTETGAQITSYTMPTEILPISGLTCSDSHLYSVTSEEWSDYDAYEKIFKLDSSSGQVLETVYNQQDFMGIPWMFALAYYDGRIWSFFTEYSAWESIDSVVTVGTIENTTLWDRVIYFDYPDYFKIRGLTYGDSFFWGYVVENDGRNAVIKISLAVDDQDGEVVLVYDAPAGSGPGIAHDGEHLWVVGNDTIYKIVP